MRRDFPIHSEKDAFSGKEDFYWDDDLPVGRQLFSEKGTSHREEIHSGRELRSRKGVSQWEVRFLVDKELNSEKGAF